VQHLEACLLCGAGSDRAAIVHERPADTLVRCPECGLLYANPQYTEEELRELYARLYYNEAALFESDAPERERNERRILYRTVLRDLFAQHPWLSAPEGAPRRRALSFGCGPGFFLAECRAAGLDCSGIEFSEAAARYAREKLGLAVRADWSRALAELPAGYYDLITMWEVIEHLQRPREVVARLAQALAPGGVLCVTTPNLLCWRYFLEHGRWFNIRNETHLALFTRSTLARLLKECGLPNPVATVFWGGRPGFTWPASLLEYVGRMAGLGSDVRLYAQKPV